MESPFDDEEVRAMFEQMGVVHKPGMAAGLMEELGPLLAAEGIDLDTWDGSNLDEVNAALANATERYNLELFTPTGDDLAGALEVLGECAEAIGEGDTGLAGLIIDSVRPEPTGDWPAVSHVIGAGLGQLDTLGMQPEFRKAFTSAKLPRWDWRATKAAKDILRRARRGKAFAGIDELILEYNGLAVIHGTVLAYAGVINALARQWSLSATQTLERLDIPRDMRMSFAISFVKLDEQFALEFEAWMELSREQLELEGHDANPLQEEEPEWSAGATLLFILARSVGIDPHDPETVGQLIEALTDLVGDDEAALLDLLMLLDDYLHFRIAMAEDPTIWDEAHDLVEIALSSSASTFEGEVEAMERLEAVATPQERKAALLASPLLAGIPQLLAWLETKPKTTGTGGLRRADIGPVAAMIGIEAEGVNKYPTVDLDSTVHYARSMDDVPELWAWFESLRFSGILDSTSTRFIPGKDAALWSNPEERELGELETVLGFFITMLLIGDKYFEIGSTEFSGTGVSMRLLANSIGFQPALAAAPAPATEPLLFGGDNPIRTTAIMVLESVGLLEDVAADQVVIPQALHATVGKALLSAILWYRQIG
ncbi:MAG: hypothetical protein QM705_04065 [Ancrocorticia sp.]